MKSQRQGSGILLCLLLLAPVALAAESLQGQLAWVKVIELSLPESGVIEKVLVNKGERVRQGQELLRLERSAEQAAVLAARARREEARLRLAEARRERERAAELYERALLSDHDLQLTQISEQAAQAQHLEADALLAGAQRQLEYGIVRAPWDGRISAVFVQPSQAVVNQYTVTPLLQLVQEQPMLVHAGITMDQRSQLSVGQEVAVAVNEQRYAGVVQALDWTAVQEPGTGYQLTVRFTPAADADLHAGMPVSVELP